LDGSRFVWFAATLLVALTVFAYRGSLGGELVLDDQLSVADNPTIRRLSNIGAVLSPPAHSPVGGRPVANLTFAVNFAIGGTSVRSYHALNLLIHVGAALLLFGIVRRTPWPARPSEVGGSIDVSAARDRLLLAFLVATLWAVHPVLTATVSYISQRTEELMGFFYLGTIYAFVRGAETRSHTWLAVSVFACALGMGSKEVMVTAPLVVLLYDRTFVIGSFRAALRQRSWYYSALAATWALLAFFMSAGLGQRSVGYGLGVSWWQYALTECGALLLYLRRAIWPHPLVFDYGTLFVSDPLQALPSVLAIAIVLGGVGFLLWRRPIAGFLSAGFFIVLAPTSSVVPVAMQPIAESRMYVPLAFVIAGLVAAMFYLLPRARGLAWAAIILGFVMLTDRRNEVFQNPAALWIDTLVKRPENARVHSNYSAVLLASGRAEEAIAYSQKALSLGPEVAGAHSNLGAALFARGRTDEAIEHERRAIALDPRLARVHANLAAALNAKGHFEEALREGRTALELLPDMTDVNYQIGNSLFHLGRPAEAIPFYQAEIRLRPDYSDARMNLGSALYMSGKPAEALEHFAAALKLQPDSVPARENLANALAVVGRPDEAINTYRELLRFRPAATSVRCNLAIVLARVGKLDEAEAEFRTALKFDANFQPALRGLAELNAVRAGQPKPPSAGR
jgi:protein O-mannosyl-transferase